MFEDAGMKGNRARGFTLLELMIVVAVIVILTLIAFPIYTEQMRKSKRAEGAQAISNLQLQLEKYRGYCTTYADQASCRDRNDDGDADDAGEPPYPSVTSTYYTISISTGASIGPAHYVITAVPKFADPKCGNLTMDYTDGVSTIGSGLGDADYCWRRK
jgi:type IV pilus assembly protein PilE